MGVPEEIPSPKAPAAAVAAAEGLRAPTPAADALAECPHGWEDLNSDQQVLLRFDMTLRFGPCLGMSRTNRWRRAQQLGFRPPLQVLHILERLGTNADCALWEARDM